MAFDYLTPDAFQPQDDSAQLDPVELYKRKMLGQAYRTRQPVRPGGSALVGVGGGNPNAGANTAQQRAIYNQYNPQQPVVQQPDASRYFTPNPEEYIGTNAPMPAESSPNRGGFNQAEGLVRPDYSRGDDLRKQANDLQHPSMWKKLVNGDEGLAIQAEHKYRLAQYEDMAANNKFRFDHPDQFKSPEKMEHLSPGTTVWSPSKGAVYTAPAKEAPEKPSKMVAFPAAGKMWQRAEDSTDPAEPLMLNTPDAVGPMPNGGTFSRPLQADANDKQFAAKGYKSENFQDKDGKWWEKVFDPDTGKTQVRSLEAPAGSTKEGRGGKAAAGAKPDWTPKDLEKIATKNAGDRRRAEASGDPADIQKTEERIRARLNSGGLEEDDTTGEVRPSAKGSEKPAAEQLKPGDTIRGTSGRKTPVPEGTVIEKNGKRYKKLRGKWVEYTGVK